MPGPGVVPPGAPGPSPGAGAGPPGPAGPGPEAANPDPGPADLGPGAANPGPKAAGPGPEAANPGPGADRPGLAPAVRSSAVARRPAAGATGPATSLVLPGRRPPLPGTEPVFVLCADQPGPALVRFLLDAHPQLACPSETRLAALCAQLAGVWSQLEGSPLPADRVSGPLAIPDAALAGIRHTMNRMMAPYLGRRGKQRYCDQSRGAAERADVLRAVFPDAKFLCLYRHPMDVIAAGLEASPWGFNGPGFDSYADPSSRNTVLAIAQFWAANAALIMAVEERFHECSHRVRYEDLVADPEGVGDRIFRFLGVAPVPGLPQACLAAERERAGPSGYQIGPSARPGSVGGGWSIPAAMIGSPLTETINVLTDKLGYPRIDAHWGLTAAPTAARGPGGRPAAPQWQNGGPAAAQRPAGVPAVEPSGGAGPEAQHPGGRPAAEPRRGGGPAAQHPAAGPAAQRPATGDGQTPPGLRLVVAHLLSGLAGIDDRFAQRWEPASQETFLVTVTSADTGAVVARWCVELRTRTITSADGVPATEMTGARWEIVGTIDVWMRVAEGEIDLSLALRRRLLRYRDTGEPASVMINRVAMLAALLGITTWQRVQPPRPGTERSPGQGLPPPRRERAAPAGVPRSRPADGRGRASGPGRERGAPDRAGPQEDEARTAWRPRRGQDAAQVRRGW
jgi:Sulfotransferase family